MSKLTSEAVTTIFMDSLFTDEEIAATPEGETPEGAVIVEGIVHTIGFHPERVESHRGEIVEMLYELPVEFLPADEGGGGGWSFLNACNDKHGVQWTGMHAVMEQLFTLGLAIGRVRLLLPRDVWPMLPGGMPYYAVTAAT